MSEIAQEIEQVETTIEHAKEMKKKAEAIRRLSMNKDFQEIVEKGYFEGEAVRLTHLYSSPMVTDEQRALIHTDLMSIGGFKRYLAVTLDMGMSAEQAIIENEHTLDALRQEALDEEG